MKYEERTRRSRPRVEVRKNEGLEFEIFQSDHENEKQTGQLTVMMNGMMRKARVVAVTIVVLAVVMICTVVVIGAVVVRRCGFRWYACGFESEFDRIGRNVWKRIENGLKLAIFLNILMIPLFTQNWLLKNLRNRADLKEPHHVISHLRFRSSFLKVLRLFPSFKETSANGHTTYSNGEWSDSPARGRSYRTRYS